MDKAGKRAFIDLGAVPGTASIEVDGARLVSVEFDVQHGASPMNKHIIMFLMLD